jgi:hypothetical protein
VCNAFRRLYLAVFSIDIHFVLFQESGNWLSIACPPLVVLNPSVLISWIDFPLDLEKLITPRGLVTDIGEKIMDTPFTHNIVIV